MEEKSMREMLDYVGLLQEQAAPQQAQQEDKMPEQQFLNYLTTMVKSFMDDFLGYVRYKQRIEAQNKKEKQNKKDVGAPGFDPIPGAGLYQGNQQ